MSDFTKVKSSENVGRVLVQAVQLLDLERWSKYDPSDVPNYSTIDTA